MSRGIRMGVLSIQGDVQENVVALSRALKASPQAGIEDSVRAVRTPHDISKLDGLVIPGGESTTIGRLSLEGDMLDTIRSKIEGGMPVLGICAGMIMLAKTANDRVVGATDQPLLGVLDVQTERNSFGRQRHSFEAKLALKPLAITEFRGVFIRAPSISDVGPGVEVLSELDCMDGQKRIVAVREGHIMGVAFHPELAGDISIHKYFADGVRRLAR